MDHTIQYAVAGTDHLSEIITLLERAKLPVSDIHSNKIHFIVATHENKVVGCIGVEKFVNEGLLRSFAVDSKYRDLKIGNALYNRLLCFSYKAGIKTLHLLTTSAKEYFLRKGFSTAERDGAPVVIKKTTEFSSLCPTSSVYMFFKLDVTALSFYNDVQVSQTDTETKSSFWSIIGKNLQFTSFEVPANTVFEKHEHDSEQITYLLEGKLFFEIDNIVHELSKGDSIVIPGGKEHRVWTGSVPAKAVDAWSPVNKKYSSQLE
jgi:amino-acid N-acetyltransferase